MSLIVNSENIVNKSFKRPCENYVTEQSSKVAKIETIFEIIQRPSAKYSEFRNLIDQGGNVNQSCLGETPLALALRLHKIKAAEILLEKGANPNISVKDEEDLIPARAYCEFYNYKSLLPHIPPDPASEEIVARKLLGQINSIDGVSKLSSYIFNLEGGCYDYFAPIMYESIGSSFDKDREHLLYALNILNEVKPNDNSALSELVLQAYQENRPVIIPLLPEGHFYSLVLHQNYLIICNRGEGLPKDHSGFSAHCIDPNEVTLDTMVWILRNQANYNAIYQELPLKLQDANSVKKDELCEVIESFSPKAQKAENCSFVNLKAALKAVWLMIKLLSKDDSEVELDERDYADEALDAEKQYKIWSYTFRAKQLAKYILNTNTLKDESLIKQCKVKLLKHFNTDEWESILLNQ